MRDENISSILSFIYWVKGLTDATSQDIGVVPKTPDSKMVLLVRRTLPESQRILCSLYQEESLFSFTHASSPFALETSGSFFKFNSFLFIYLFFFFNLIFYSFIRSLQILAQRISQSPPDYITRPTKTCGNSQQQFASEPYRSWLRIRRLYPLQRAETPPPMSVLSMTLNGIWWWGSNSGSLGSGYKSNKSVLKSITDTKTWYHIKVKS